MSIYVLRHGDLYKIGYSSDLQSRVKAIIRAIPGGNVQFVGHMPGDRDVEAHFHALFDADRFSGEWFVATERMVDLFDLILDATMPEEPNAVAQAHRGAASADVKAFSHELRKQALAIWPDLSHANRVKALATRLGWTKSRTKDLYYADARAVPRAHEGAELTAAFTPPGDQRTPIYDEDNDDQCG